ncbi:MAG: metal ABC transporter ATP-binding protein [Anaerolineae bacterium]|nr:metal ABC transporter ATP-binding protein [Anaerolineae bacterium]
MPPEITNTFTYGRVCTVPTVPGEPALEIKELTFTYPGADGTALDGVSLMVMPGEKVALVGPNGAGKSTLIKLIAGLSRPPSGSIVVYGNMAGACHHRVAYVPQRGDVDWRFPVTAREVVMMGRYAHLGWLRWPSHVDHEAVERALATMNVADLADKQIGELSGGQQQRVMLARALAQEADLLLLDEPLNNLDVPTQELIFGVLDDQAAQGRTLIVSTHDLGVLPLHFTRAVFLDGHVVVDGPVNEVLTARTLLRAYGVRLHPHEGIWDDDMAD